MNNTLQFASNEQIDEQESAQAKAKEEASSRMMPLLSAHVLKKWHEAKTAKIDITKRLLNCSRRRNSEYGDMKLANIRKSGGSEMFSPITATTCRGAAAWIKDILLPAGDKSWGISSTPIPDVQGEVRQAAMGIVAQEAKQAIAQGIQLSQDDIKAAIEKVESQIIDAEQEKADKAMEKMETLIEDQLEEGGWYQGMQNIIDDFVTYPTCFMRKGLIRNRKQLEWVQEQGKWTPKAKWATVEEWERVSPFDIYPAPYAQDLNSSALIQKHRFTVGQLSSMRGVEGYDTQAIERVLGKYEGGLQSHDFDDVSKRKAEMQSDQLQQSTTIDALELWDDITGKMLLDWNAGRGLIQQEIDPYAIYSVTVIAIGDEVISAEVNPDLMGNKPYGFASFENVAGSVWGIGLPELISQDQDMCNSSARSLENNMAMASAPMMAVDVSALPAGADVTSIRPWKVVQYNGAEANGRNPISFFQPQSNANELVGIFDKFSVLAEEHSGVPKYTYGNTGVGGAGKTASGLSMLMGNASKGIKAAIAHLDNGIIKYLIKMQYQHNMLYHPDESVKGDANIIARGSSALMLKEIQQMRRTELLQSTANPIDMQIIGMDGRAELLREAFKANDLHDIVPSKEDLRLRNEANQQAATQGVEQSANGQPIQ